MSRFTSSSLIGALAFAFAISVSAQQTSITPGKDGPGCVCTSMTPDTDPPEPNPASWGAFAPIAQPGADFDLEVPAHDDPSGPVEYRWQANIGGTPLTPTVWSTSTTTTYDGFGEATYCFQPEARDRFKNTTKLGDEKCEVAFP